MIKLQLTLFFIGFLVVWKKQPPPEPAVNTEFFIFGTVVENPISVKIVKLIKTVKDEN